MIMLPPKGILSQKRKNQPRTVCFLDSTRVNRDLLWFFSSSIGNNWISPSLFPQVYIGIDMYMKPRPFLNFEVFVKILTIDLKFLELLNANLVKP